MHTNERLYFGRPDNDADKEPLNLLISEGPDFMFPSNKLIDARLKEFVTIIEDQRVGPKGKVYSRKMEVISKNFQSFKNAVF